MRKHKRVCQCQMAWYRSKSQRKTPMREKRVGVAVVIDDLDRFLLVRQPRWRGDFAFPMKDVDAEDEVLPSTAIAAVEGDLGRRLPRARAKELSHLGKFGISGSTGAETLYDYWAYE